MREMFQIATGDYYVTHAVCIFKITSGFPRGIEKVLKVLKKY